MNFKNFLVLLLTGILSLSVVACSSSNENKVQDKTLKVQDKTFIEDVKKSFEERSSYIDDVESGKIVLGINEYSKEAVQKEKNILDKYENSEFNNPELGKLAKDYISGLNKQTEALKYFSSDYNKYDKLWSEGNDIRSTTLTTLVNKFGLELNDKHFEQLKNSVQDVKEKNHIKSQVDDMLKNIKFEKVKEEYGWKDYEAIVENTSGVDFNKFYLDVSLLNSDGIEIEKVTATAKFDDVWEKGQKAKLVFSTETDFSKMEWKSDYSIKK